MARPHKVLSKVIHLYAGVDLIGSVTSISSKKAELEVTPIGVKMKSKATKRVVLIPWSNIKGCELLEEQKEKPNETEIAE